MSDRESAHAARRRSRLPAQRAGPAGHLSALVAAASGASVSSVSANGSLESVGSLSANAAWSRLEPGGASLHVGWRKRAVTRRSGDTYGFFGSTASSYRSTTQRLRPEIRVRSQ